MCADHVTITELPAALSIRAAGIVIGPPALGVRCSSVRLTRPARRTA